VTDRADTRPDLQPMVDPPAVLELSTTLATDTSGLQLPVDPPPVTEASESAANSTPIKIAVALSPVTKPSMSDSHAASPSFREMIPVPTKLQPKSNQSGRKRRAGHACIITASPHKKMLVDSRQQKKEVTEKKAERKAKMMQKKMQKKVEADSKKAGKTKETKRRQRKRKQKVHNEDSQHKSGAFRDDSDCACLYCDGLYSQSSEDFVACQGECGEWAHTGCANLSSNGQFVCEVCEN